MIERTPEAIVERTKRLRKPENWQPPRRPPFTRIFTPIICSSGVVCGIGRHNAATLVRNAKAILWVRWWREALPPGVKIGARVALIGKLRTYNEGRRLQVHDALLLRRSPKSILSALVKTLPDLVVDPREYLIDDDLEKLDLLK